jgi:eukaryotic-like serine/threonine-protein kinase
MSQLNVIGTTLGRFEIISELGRGGMAVVYKARQADLDRIVAIKLLPPEMTHDTNYVARFRHEARSAARLEHPHIMPVYEVGETNGLHYIAMKYIQGRTLKDVVQQDGALSVRRAAEVLAQVGDALDYAHRQGIIHRDIKPSNVMITDEGWVYLTDFGLARGTDTTTSGLTMAGTVMGTPEYMSPEQAQGLASVGPPTDIYALGVVLYELLTGTFPFHAETPMAMLAARLLQSPIPPRDVRGDLPVAVEDVVMRSLARKPEARFASAAEMVTALRAAAGIGANPQAQPPLTPVGGVPAIGETLVASPPIETPPYVRPQVSAPPPQAYVAPTQAAPQRGDPVLGLPSLPVPGVSGTKPKTGLFIGVGATVLVLVIAFVGMFVYISRPAPGPGPTPASGPTDSALTRLLQQADTSLANGDSDTAFDQYQQALGMSADNTAALSGIAIVDNMRADWKKAEQSATNLVNASRSTDKNKAAALGLALLADAVSSQNKVTDAADSIPQALKLDGDLALAHAINSNLMAIQAYGANDTAGMDKALREADKAVDSVHDETLPIQALTYHAIGFTFAQDYALSRAGGRSPRKSSLTEGTADYRKAIELQPNLPLFHTNLGYLLSNAEDYNQARVEFQRAINLDDTSEAAHNGMAWSFFNSADYAQAEKEFRRATALAPDYANAHYGLGLTLENLDRKDDARTEFQQTLTLDPSYTAAQNALDRMGK